MTQLEKLATILEHSYNAYTFRYRCNGLYIVIEKQPDGTIVVSWSDDLDGLEIVDVSQPPFDKIL